MTHGDIADARYAKCGCAPCVASRRFAEFRDLAIEPERPAAINSRIEAAAYLRWHAAQLVQLIDDAEGVDASD
jgi:hypothetical protein